MAELYAPGRDKTHPWLSPLYGDLLGLPPMQLYVGTDELLFDDAIRFYRKSRRAGNQVELIVGDHMPHSWADFYRGFSRSGGSGIENGGFPQAVSAGGGTKADVGL